jgi:hypothetical protein
VVPRTGVEPNAHRAFRHNRPWADRFGAPTISTKKPTLVPRTGIEPNAHRAFRHNRPWADRFGAPTISTKKPTLVPRTGIEPVRPLCRKAADFKSAVSTNFTTEALKNQVIVSNKKAPQTLELRGFNFLEARPRVELG